MTEAEWIEKCETIQSEALSRGLINPFDILILAYKRTKVRPANLNWKVRLYQHYERLRKFILSTKQDKSIIKHGSVLFFPVEPTHVNQMIPVAQVLAKSNMSFHFVTSRIKIFRQLKSMGFQVRLITGRNRIPAGGIEIMHLGELEGRRLHLSTEIASHLKHSYIEIARLSASLQILLKDCKPCYVFIGNDLTWEGRLLASLSKVMNLRTGMIQHGLLGNEIYNRFHIIDDFYVYGQAFKRILQEDGLVTSNLQVTGPPYLDQRRVNRGNANATLRKAFDLKGSFVLVALSGTGDRTSVRNYGQSLSLISRLISDHPEVDFLIKLHRKESIDAYAAFPSRQKFRIVDRRRALELTEDIFDWLEGCSCLITGTSAVAYEAMRFNIPIISLDPLKEYHGVNFIDERVVDVVSTHSELEEALIRLNGQRVDYRPFLNDIFGELDGKAADRVAAGIPNCTIL